MALTFSEGSIGGDIERVNLTQLEAFYGAGPKPVTTTASAADVRLDDLEPRGSNGIAIAPSNTTGGKALLLINPHTSFFFRAEAQMVSDEGLNAYGAITWGQFFIYQGFNDRAGWMHTSSGVDNIDEYLETIVKKGDEHFYKYGAEERPVTATTIKVPYKSGTGMAEKSFTVYRTHHGPIVREADGKWVSIRLMQEPIKALTQSYSRTKAKNYKAFRESMDLHTNSSNNTIYADADGTIAYFHSNFIPKRDAKFDWTKPGGRQRSGDGMERRAVDRRDARPAQSRERLALQHQQLAVVGGRRRQPEEGRLSRLRRSQRREPARHPRDPRPREQEGLHAGVTAGRRLRQLPAGVRRADPARW